MNKTSEEIAPTNSSVSLVFTVLLLWFIAKAIFFAFHVSPGLLPDEMFHLQLIDEYRHSKTPFPFNESWNSTSPTLEKYVVFGGTVERPYLFHLLFGNALRFFSNSTFDFATIVTLRLINVILASLTVLVSFRLFRLLLSTKSELILAGVLSTNMLMFTFLASAVNYDNLANLFAVLAFYFFVKFLKKEDRVLHLGIVICLGLLTKLSVLPLIVPIVGIVMFQLLFSKEAREKLNCNAVLLGVFLLCFTLVLELYGANIYQYHTVNPNCAQVFSEDLCENNSFHVREKTTQRILKNEPHVNAIRYSFFWAYHVIERTIGVYGKQGIEHPESAVTMVAILIGIALVTGLLYRKQFDATKLAMAAICLFHILVVLFLWNYLPHPYLSSWKIQGRYLFPVLSPLIILFVYSILLPFTSKRKSVVALLLATVFLYLETPYVVGSEAFRSLISPKPQDFYQKLEYYPNPIYNLDFEIVELPSSP